MGNININCSLKYKFRIHFHFDVTKRVTNGAWDMHIKR